MEALKDVLFNLKQCKSAWQNLLSFEEYDWNDGVYKSFTFFLNSLIKDIELVGQLVEDLIKESDSLQYLRFPGLVDECKKILDEIEEV